MNTSNTSRRDFLKILSYSAGAAALFGACRQPVRKAIPYIIQPEELTPGKSLYYATSFQNGHGFYSVVAKVRDGRPIKLDGNHLCPINKGGSNVQLQASLLNQYDTDRIQNPAIYGKKVAWDTVDNDITKQLKNFNTRDKRVLLLANYTNSPTTNQIFKNFQAKYPNIEVVQCAPHSYPSIIEANKTMFGKACMPSLQLDKANLVVSFGADFLSTFLNPIEQCKQYSSKRNADSGNMLQHIQLESSMSLTGSNADKRYTIHAFHEEFLLKKILTFIENPENIGFQTSSDINSAIAANIADKLLTHKAESLVLSGNNNLIIQQLVNQINFKLGNYNNTLLLNTPENDFLVNHSVVKQKLKELEKGAYNGLILYHTNPVYNYPKSISGKSIEKLELSISIDWYHNESNQFTEYLCPDHYFLESWGDYQPKQNYYALQQPVIQHLFDTRQAQDNLLRWMENPTEYKDYLENYWGQNIYPLSEQLVTPKKFWYNSLKQGFFIPEKQINEKPGLHLNNDSISISNTPENNDTPIIIELKPSPNLGSGVFVNNPWIYELPDPVSKICWDNYASISKTLAEEYQLKTGSVIKINGEIEVPVYIQPGQHTGVITLYSGFGRKGLGRVANGVGVYIKTRNNIVQVETIEKTDKKYAFAFSQEHHDMAGRDIVRYLKLSEIPALKKKAYNYQSMYKKPEFQQFHWGMAIDLSKCIGCSACVISCQAENNIPVVGKAETAKNRDMHWIRIDRYFEETADGLKVLFQPVMCQHCDQAPCENVCPVAATSHSNEGINQMIYNRCIGTRYCANNCPYKVRRFNWFDYTKADAIKNNTHDPFKLTHKIPRLVLNPDVTVRSKGVIEKCSFCYQRIAETKNKAKLENRVVTDGEIKTACQQACPTNAIVFGNLNDEKSEISKLINSERSYRLLDDLHTLPSVNYLADVTNE